MSIDNPAPKGQEDSARGFNPGYGKPRGAALKVLPTPRTRVQFQIGAVLQHSRPQRFA
jgi:hypothetical protein